MWETVWQWEQMIGTPRVGRILVDGAPLFQSHGLCDMNSTGLRNAHAKNLHFIGQVVGCSGGMMWSDDEVLMLLALGQVMGWVVGQEQ